MQVRQFRFSVDNLAYLVHSAGEAMAIDGGAVDEILAYLSDHRLKLSVVAHTHNHPDHTPGSARLMETTGAILFDPETVNGPTAMDLGDETIDVLPTPGHTRDSVTYRMAGALITGDTLFNGTVGNCFSGDIEAFYRSIKQLMQFDPATRVYAGHDYMREALGTARQLEPQNAAIDEVLARYDPNHVVTTLADELAVNPYLRFNTDEMKTLFSARGLAADTEWRRWQSVMTL